MIRITTPVSLPGNILKNSLSFWFATRNICKVPRLVNLNRLRCFFYYSGWTIIFIFVAEFLSLKLSSQAKHLGLLDMTCTSLKHAQKRPDGMASD